MKNLILTTLLLIFSGCGSDDQEISTDNAMQIIIDEKFTTYDESVWLKADWANGDPFYNGWLPENVEIDDGKMVLALTVDDAHGADYASGEYRTVGTYMYGYYSARFQASDLNGTISSFFTYTGEAEGTEWDEIDVEILGKDPTKVQLNYWRNGHEHPVVIDLGFDASKNMHTYAFMFSKESIKWYVDDKFIYSVEENNLSDNDSLPVNAGKIIVNYWAATGIDSWSGHYEENTTSSVTYEEIIFKEF